MFEPNPSSGTVHEEQQTEHDEKKVRTEHARETFSVGKPGQRQEWLGTRAKRPWTSSSGQAPMPGSRHCRARGTCEGSDDPAGGNNALEVLYRLALHEVTSWGHERVVAPAPNQHAGSERRSLD